MQIDLNEVKKGGLYIGSPMYRMQCFGNFTVGIFGLASLCGQHGMNLGFHCLPASYITAGRNMICDEFLKQKEMSHILFIDTDIGFDPRDALAMRSFMTEDSPYDIMGASYPRRVINWDRVRNAAITGKEDLERHSADMNLWLLESDVETMEIEKPHEVIGIPGGFMMIKRTALEKFRDHHHAQFNYYEKSIDKDVTQFFHVELDPKSRYYMSDDYWFCTKAREAGLRVWLAPWPKLTHLGEHVFNGSLVDMYGQDNPLTANDLVGNVDV